MTPATPATPTRDGRPRIAVGLPLSRRLASSARRALPRWPSGRGTTASQKNGRPACASRPKVCVNALVRGD
jgi:hypothetical protein